MNTTTNLTTRESLAFWLNENGLLGEGAEIGCAFGQFATLILSTWKGKKLHLIDPWSKRPDAEYLEITNQTADFDQWYKDCQSLSERDPRAVLHRMKSTEGALQFGNDTLDFVYIDGAHDYRNVLDDLDAWYGKVKSGGLFGGHDFYDSKEGGGYSEVASAVIRWMKDRNLVFSVTPCTSWWIIKS